MNYKEGEVWVLDDGKEYLIVYTLDIGVNHYVVLLSEEEPIQMKIGMIMKENDELKFKACANKEEAMYVLEAIQNQKKIS